VSRHGLILKVWSSFLESNRDLGEAEVVSVPCFSVIIAVIDQAVTTEDSNLAATVEISRHVILFLAHAHTGTVSKNGSLSQLLLLQQLGEGCLTVVGSVDFFDFNCIVSKEVV